MTDEMSETAERPQPIALSTQNARLKRLRRLVRQSKVRSTERAFVVDGPTLVAEALASTLRVEGIYVGSVSGYELLHAEVAKTGAVLGPVPVYAVDDDVLASLLDPANPRPVAAVVEMPESTLDGIDADLPVIVAVELADPGNLGTLIRTAEAAGFGGVLVVGQAVDHLNPKTVRSSAGSVLRLPVVRFTTADAAFDTLRSSGRPVVATVLDEDAPSYDRIDLTSAALVLGNEPRGLEQDLITRCDAAVTIPMADGVESLNVGAAAAVLAFEVARQRRRRKTDPIPS